MWCIKMCSTLWVIGRIVGGLRTCLSLSADPIVDGLGAPGSGAAGQSAKSTTRTAPVSLRLKSVKLFSATVNRIDGDPPSWFVSV